MINLNPEARLNILLNSSNKALADVIKNATPQQLQALNDGKDIKSLLQGVLNDTLKSSKSDQILLEMLKNSPNFKQLGEFNSNLKTLIETLKQENLPQNIKEKLAVLEKFMSSIKDIDPKLLKSQINSSGVFMESKLASSIQKLPDTLKTLDTLMQVLKNIPKDEAKTLSATIEKLLSNPIVKGANISEIKANTLSNNLKEIVKSLQDLTPKATLPKEIYNLASKLEVLVQNLKLEQNPSLNSELKMALTSLQTPLSSLATRESFVLLESLDKIFKALEFVKVEEFSTKLQEFIKQNPKELLSLTPKLQAAIEPKSILLETLIKEELRDDIKANLLKLKDELGSQNTQLSSRAMELSDRLLTQIDYHQLLSHLSSSSSLYLPFSWELLEEGSLYFKKHDEEKFYCHIDLKLKEYGDISLMLSLYDENQFELYAVAQKEEFAKLLQENLYELRAKLIESEVVPKIIRVTHENQTTQKMSSSYTSYVKSDSSFEVKV